MVNTIFPLATTSSSKQKGVRHFKTLLVSVFLGILSLSTSAQVIIELSVQNRFEGLADNTYSVTVQLVDGDSPVAQWEETHTGLRIVNEYLVTPNLLLGGVDPINNPLSATDLDLDDPKIKVYALGTRYAVTSLTSIPYAIKANLADDAIYVSANRITGAFTTTMSIGAGINVSQGLLYREGSSPNIGISQTNPAYPLDVAGQVNATELKLNGVSFLDTLAWQKTATNTNNIYATRNVGINLQSQLNTAAFKLDVIGVVNAKDLYQDGKPISAGLDWQPPEDDSVHLVLLDTSTRVGIGRLNPSQYLDINGGLRVSGSTTELAGTIRTNESKTAFEGFTGTEWRLISNLYGNGTPGALTVFEDEQGLTSTASFHFDHASTQLGIGTANPQAKIDIQQTTSDNEILHVKNAEGNTLFYINPSGNIGLGTTTVNREMVVSGTINVRDLTLNGRPIELALSRSSAWLLNDEDAVYYTLGNIGIGRPDPRSLLEIAQPSGQSGDRPGQEPTDPAISFSYKKDPVTATESYTVGIDAATFQDNPVFRIERGLALGQNQPLFSIKEGKLGLGITDPKANLHVSGNSGVVFQGEFFGIEDETFANVNELGDPIPLNFAEEELFKFSFSEIEGLENDDVEVIFGHLKNRGYIDNRGALTSLFTPGETGFSLGLETQYQPFESDIIAKLLAAQAGRGTRFLFRPERAALRVGHLDINSPLGATEWDDYNLGKFSVGFGRNTLASGNFSTIWGGENNQAGGAYATILGGSHNKALGFASMAAGHYAYAMHHGSFVYSDNEESTEFRSTHENQFLIRAKNGFGIQKYAANDAQTIPMTLDSKRAYFVVQNEAATGNLMRFISPLGVTDSIITTSGNVGFGYTGPMSDPLIVFGGMRAGSEPSANTLTGNTQLLMTQETPSDHIFIIYKHDQITSPSFVIQQHGHAGIGVIPTAFSPTEAAGLQNDGGSIRTDAVEFPDGTQLSGKNVIVWRSPSPNVVTPDVSVYYVSGNIGIGTPDPQSLLELSNFSATAFGNRLNPAITFDLNGVDIGTLGVNMDSPDTFLMMNGRSLNTASPIFALNDTGVGIGTFSPSSSLHSVKPTIMEGVIRIATTNTTFALSTTSANLQKDFYVQYMNITSSGTKWIPSSNPLVAYRPNGAFIGIGTNTPNEQLEVAGTLNATNYSVANLFKINNFLRLDKLYLTDLDDDTLVSLSVKNGQLFVGDDTNLSDTLTRGSGGSGPLGIFIDDPRLPRLRFLGRTTMDWDTDTLTIPVSLRFNQTTSLNSLALVTQNFTFDETTLTEGIVLTTELGHDNDTFNSASLDANNISIHFDDDWYTVAEAQNGTNPPTVFDTVGLRVNLTNTQNTRGELTKFGSNSAATGLFIDVNNTDLIPQEDVDPGFIYAALFQGNVGIGKFPLAAANQPGNVILDVVGKVAATSFNIGQRLTITTLNVSQSPPTIQNPSALLVPTSGFVGINIVTPSAKLDVKGDVRATAVQSQGASAATLTAGQDGFVVKASGLIGMGTTDPSAQLHLTKTFTNRSSENYRAFGVSANFTENVANIRGLDIAFVSSGNNINFLGSETTGQTATGLLINLPLTASVNNTVTGLSFNYPDANTSNYTAAVFLGGNVGIGERAPDRMPLHVKGTMRGKNVRTPNPGSSLTALLTDQEGASFNMLHVVQDAVFSGQITANNMFIPTISMGTERLAVNAHLNLPLISLTITGNPGSMEVSTLNSTTDLNVFNGQFTGHTTANSMSITGLSTGTSTPRRGVSIVNGTTSQELIVTGSLTSLALTVSRDRLVVNTDGNVGIHTSSPVNNLHISPGPLINSTTDLPSAFNPADNRTWNAIRVQNSTVTDNATVGLLFIPDSSNTPNVGSGIVAQEVLTNGSELLFITDPATGDRESRMVITDEGQLLVGTDNTTLTEKLVVDGSFKADGLRITDSLNLTRIDDIDGIVLDADTVFSSTVNISSFFLSNGEFLLESETTAPLSPITGNYNLYVNGAASNGLYLSTRTPQGLNVVSDMTLALLSDTGTIPFYNSTQTLTDNPEMHLVTTNIGGRLVSAIIITSNLTTPTSSLHLSNTLQNSQTGQLDMNTIEMHFQNRLTGAAQVGNSIFVGADVSVSSTGTQELASNELAYGLKIDLRDLKDQFRTLDPSAQVNQGYKYAGLFTGGNFLIGTSITQPTASVYITHASPNAGLMVESNQSLAPSYSIVVSANGQTGFGTIPNAAQVQIKKTAASNTLFQFDSNSGTTAFAGVQDSSGRLKIGDTASSTNHSLGIDGDITASDYTASGGLNSETLTVAGTVDDRDVLVGSLGIRIGDGALENAITLRHSLATANNVPHVSHETHSYIQDNLTYSLVGHDVVLKSDSAYDQFGTGITPRTAIGASVDLTALSNSDLTGLAVTVTNNKVAAIFNGGNVGIGTTVPTHTLSVIGTIKATGNFIGATPNLVVQNIAGTQMNITGPTTLNAFHVPTTINVTSTLTTDLVSDLVDRIDTANYLSALDLGAVYATMNKLLINPWTGLSTNGIQMAVTDEAILDGIVTINQTITANTLGMGNASGTFNVDITTMTVSASYGANVWKFTPRTSAGIPAILSGLFVDSALTNELSYLKAGGATKELSQNFSGDANQLVFYAADGSFSSVDTLQFENDNNVNVLRIITPTEETNFIVSSNIPETGDYTAHKITQIIPARTPDIAGTAFVPIYGLEIKTQGIGPTAGPTTNEASIGLFVDTSELIDHSSSRLPPELDSDVVGSKASAAFLGGSVYVVTDGGITAGNPWMQAPTQDAALNIHGGDAFTDIINIRNNTTQSFFSQSRTGNVKIGTTNRTEDFFHIHAATTTENILLIGTTDKTIFSMNKTDTRLGLGQTAPSSSLHLTQIGSLDDTLLRADVDTHPDAVMVIKSTGKVGMGRSQDNPVALLDVSGNLTLRTGDDHPIFVTKNVVGFGVQPDLNFALTTKTNLQLGSTKNIGVEPAASKGIYAGPVVATGAISLVSSRNATNNDYNVILQAHRLDDFKIAHDATTRILMRDGKVGIGLTTTASATLHVTNAQNTSTAAFKVASTNLIVQSTGAVAINTSNTTEALRVKGLLQATSIEDAAHTGTIFTAPTMIVSNNAEGLVSNMQHHIVVTQNFAFTAESLTFTLSGDQTDTPIKELLGLNIDVNSDQTGELDNTTAGKAFGLMVDIGNFDVDFIHENGNSAAEKYAASFLGGFVGMGTITPDAQIQVQLASNNGTIREDGTVAIFRSTPNIVPGGSLNPGTSLLLDAVPDFIRNELDETIAIPTEALQTIVYTLGDGEVYGDKTIDGLSVFYMDLTQANALVSDAGNQYSPSLIRATDHKPVATSRALIKTLAGVADTSFGGTDGYIEEYITTRDIYTVIAPYVYQDAFRFKTINHDVGGLTQTGLVLSTGTSPKIPYVTDDMTGEELLALGRQFIGKVGIGFTGDSDIEFLDKELVVSGDVLVEGVDSKIYFSGDPIPEHLSVTDSDNNDELSMYRHIVDPTNSEFRISVGENAAVTKNVSFKIGATTSPNFNTFKKGTYIESFSIDAYDFDLTGVDSDSFKAMVSIGGGTTPSANLHIRGNKSFDESTWTSGLTNPQKTAAIRGFADNSLVLIENGGTGAASLEIRHSHTDVVGNMPDTSNFITFKSSPAAASITTLNQVTHLGSIEGDSTNDGGIQFKSAGADYAEYLPKLVASEKIQPGDIVGIFNGKITKSIEGAQQIMVASVTPIVAGNWQGPFEKHLQLVSFLGQVPVRVMGPVAAGDLIIASGKNDGTGLAISPDDISEETVDLIVGQAWETKTDPAIGPINTAVGFPFAYHAMAQKMHRVSQYKTHLNALQSSVDQLQDRYEGILEKQALVLEKLKEKAGK